MSDPIRSALENLVDALNRHYEPTSRAIEEALEAARVALGDADAIRAAVDKTESSAKLAALARIMNNLT